LNHIQQQHEKRQLKKEIGFILSPHVSKIIVADCNEDELRGKCTEKNQRLSGIKKRCGLSTGRHQAEYESGFKL